MPDPRGTPGTNNPSGKNAGVYKRIPCPDCGRLVGNLPNHLPCDGGDDVA